MNINATDQIIAAAGPAAIRIRTACGCILAFGMRTIQMKAKDKSTRNLIFRLCIFKTEE